jgi:hypothetical protein
MVTPGPTLASLSEPLYMLCRVSKGQRAHNGHYVKLRGVPQTTLCLRPRLAFRIYILISATN